MSDALSPGHTKCRHKVYRFTCAEFDRLLDRADRRCEICRRPLLENRSHGVHVDHDHAVAVWAVRGVLCQACNSYNLPFRKPTAAVVAYLANPWYLTLIADAGTSLQGPPEPALDQRVADRVGKRIWRRESQGWTATSRSHRPWSDVVLELGPHNIVLLGSSASAQPRRITIRPDSSESAAQTLRKHMPLEARQALARLLLEE